MIKTLALASLALSLAGGADAGFRRRCLHDAVDG